MFMKHVHLHCNLVTTSAIITLCSHTFKSRDHIGNYNIAYYLLRTSVIISSEHIDSYSCSLTLLSSEHIDSYSCVFTYITI